MTKMFRFLNFPPGAAKISVLRLKILEIESAIILGSIWAILYVYYINNPCLQPREREGQ